MHAIDAITGHPRTVKWIETHTNLLPAQLHST